MDSIEPRYLVDSELVSITRQIHLSDNVIDIYFHDSWGPAFVYGGVYGSQYINALAWDDSDLGFAREFVQDLDARLDININLTSDKYGSDVAIYLDEEILIDGSPGVVGLAVSNSTVQRENFWEIFLDKDGFGDSNYFRYGLIHELGHVFGLEHPFSSKDGDLYGSIADPSLSAFPEQTVMSYRYPLHGIWPNDFSRNDWNALESVWGVSGNRIDSFVVGEKYYLPHVRDFDGILHGNSADSVSSSYVYQGSVDVDNDGMNEFVYTNEESGRWVTAGSDLDFSDYGPGGDTRIVGLYEDPLVIIGEVEIGSPHDSQVRFQNDLYDDNLRLGGAADVDSDGFSEVFWNTTDDSAFLRSIHHLDGNVKYANYMNAGQMSDYLSQHGHMGDIGSILGL